MILIRLDSSTRRGCGPLRRVHFMELACTPFPEFCRLPLTPPALEIKMLFSPPRASLPVIIRRSKGVTKKRMGGGEEERGLVSPAVIAVWP